MANDLSEFRKKWLKELEHENEQETVKSEKPGTSYSADDIGSSQSQQSEFQTTSYLSAQQPNDARAEDSFQQEPGHRKSSLEDEHKQSNHHVEDVPPVPEGNQHREIVHDAFDFDTEASATYYPFRILTTLLNHASTEEGPKRTRREQKQKQKKSPTDIPKRTYFSCVDEVQPAAPKKAKKENVKNDHNKRGADSKGYLDLFIDDLNEISEIPFFDVSLPREVAIKIFWHLDIVDLCRCAQVSKSWRSLAEDELLWCNISHSLGFETDALTVEHSNWKSRIRQYVSIKQTLELNWKGRTGKLHNLHHAKGGVLCAVHSNKSTIVAGYSNCQTKLWDVMSGETCIFQPSSIALLIDEAEEEGTICARIYSNCQTKLWDVMSGETCIFQPSSTALLIDEAEEEGTISNEVLHVATCDKVTAASYSHGFVDVWSNEEGTEAMYTFTCEGQGSYRQPTSLQLWENTQGVYLSVSSGYYVQVHSVCNGEGRVRETLVFDSLVKKTKWLQDPKQTAGSVPTPTLTVATNSTVSVVALYDREATTTCSYDLAELHNIVDAPVTCMDTRLHPQQVLVGFTLNTGPAQYFRVDVYDLLTQKVTSTLGGHTACVLCANLEDSPPHQLVTGSRDRKVRVFDTRVAQSPLMTLMGHSAAVTTVQMDQWKVVSGDEAGFVCVWDQRMASKLWEMNNRHPVRYCHCEDRQLVIGHVPYIKHHYNTFDFDTGLHQRHRGSLHVYDFLADQTTQGVPEICLSTYDEPQGYNYNISLAVPYDQV